MNLNKQKTKKAAARLILLTVSRTCIKWNFLLLLLLLSSSLGLRLPRNKEEPTQNEKKKKTLFPTKWEYIT